MQLTLQSSSRSKGFTLVEAMIAVVVLTTFMLACFSSITFSRVASTKARDEAIVMDFLVHYAETIKALPFDQVVPGNAVNQLFDGSGNSPDIRIPADSSWVPLNTDDYETFHPGLLSLHNRNPKMQVSLVTTSVGGAPHTRELNLKVAWDAPLYRGGRLEEQVDIVREKDL